MGIKRDDYTIKAKALIEMIDKELNSKWNISQILGLGEVSGRNLVQHMFTLSFLFVKGWRL
jgi:hypothetical protein